MYSLLKICSCWIENYLFFGRGESNLLFLLTSYSELLSFTWQVKSPVGLSPAFGIFPYSACHSKEQPHLSSVLWAIQAEPMRQVVVMLTNMNWKIKLVIREGVTVRADLKLDEQNFLIVWILLKVYPRICHSTPSPYIRSWYVILEDASFYCAAFELITVIGVMTIQLL